MLAEPEPAATFAQCRCDPVPAVTRLPPGHVLADEEARAGFTARWRYGAAEPVAVGPGVTSGQRDPDGAGKPDGAGAPDWTGGPDGASGPDVPGDAETDPPPEAWHCPHLPSRPTRLCGAVGALLPDTAWHCRQIASVRPRWFTGSAPTLPAVWQERQAALLASGCGISGGVSVVSW